MLKGRIRLCLCCAVLALSTIPVMLTVEEGAAAARIPLPRPRPFIPAPRTTGTVEAPHTDVSACAERMATVAVIQPLPPIEGPGACGADDAVRLVAIFSPAAVRMKVDPPAVLRCGMAEALAHWVREASETALRDSGGIITGLTTATSFDCRGQNGVPNAKLSQHGLANAVDVRALMFRDGKMLVLTDPTAPLHVRAWLHDSACKRFTTVLGPGSDGYHEDHIHLDLAERRSGYRICQWDVHDDVN
jgi:hypothetical protein